ncbi:hypothetical protein PF005_g22253 [Phytophthora fragariae]|uniref:Uncharacterized protein n=1 Tax=Phytophthora fragariae TaxID=53985 RepID=A0A6A4C9K6_9STRA|nr:hypothetical protein PF009_g23059 [Phytophthora fragariae]KAE9106859.1 hypothetical protein PF006_g21262 [Phytophthora fragariae]KAE9183043.1 hypothetical protein PF005_g22253 [Phytophthora fragariae]KAE9193323.1 hypothetical protein PF004_g21046 [Phytophthora fragariae]KAE9195713.1 hypothetical protein PF002_g23243 [Phytophthora fragariae]
MESQVAGSLITSEEDNRQQSQKANSHDERDHDAKVAPDLVVLVLENGFNVLLDRDVVDGHGSSHLLKTSAATIERLYR